MKKFSTLTSKVMPIPIKDIDTDMIIPAQYLTSIHREGYGQHLFARLKSMDSNFPSNQACYVDAEIMLADSNFGCGSSREHAVWALQQAGFKVIIAASFSDIFFNNGTKNGLLLIRLPEEVIQKLFNATPEQLTVALDNQTVTTPSGECYSFDYDPFRKHCLLECQDDLDYLLAHKREIAHYEKTHRNTCR